MRERRIQREAEPISDFCNNVLEVCIDGGWAVDALLGRETRAHGDLDIALPHRNVPRLRTLLSKRDYRERIRDDTWECNFVLADTKGRELDVHSYTLDSAGNNVHGVAYEAEHLAGTGSILGRGVRCISPEWLVRFHTGYEVDEKDFQDASALCQHFGIALPKEYHRFILGTKS